MVLGYTKKGEEHIGGEEYFEIGLKGSLGTILLNLVQVGWIVVETWCQMNGRT